MKKDGPRSGRSTQYLYVMLFYIYIIYCFIILLHIFKCIYNQGPFFKKVHS